MGRCESFGKCSAVVPYATADGESGSGLKFGSVWINIVCPLVMENLF
jgi:hypothetical protein